MVRLSEKTHESFSAIFRSRIKTLTLAFNGQSFQLTLEQSKTRGLTGVSSSKSKVPKLPAPQIKRCQYSQGYATKATINPQLPDWLVQRSQKSGISNSSNPGSRVSILSNHQAERFCQGDSSRGLSHLLHLHRGQTVVHFRAPSSTGPVPQVSAPISNVPSFSGVSLNEGPSSGIKSSISNSIFPGDEIDLSALPPPPPPPNILPPSGPPDIIPSRDE